MGVNQTAPDAQTYGQVTDEASLIEDRPASSTTQSVIQSGWDAAEKLVTVTTDYPVEYKHSDQFQLIKFIDTAGPFANYRQHFLNKKTEGRRSYVCLGEKCPLCLKLNDKPEVKRGFSIVNLSAKPFQRQMLIATPKLYKVFHAAEFSPQGPLTKNYWALSRSGVKQQTHYNFTSVKARDLSEDWGLSAEEVEAAVSSFTPFERAAIREDSYADLVDIAESLL